MNKEAYEIVRAPETSAQPCGCDVGAKYRCQDYPMCPAGPEARSHKRSRSSMESAQTSEARLMGGPQYAQAVTKGLGGAPVRASSLPDDPAARKRFPIASGVLDYFPDALLAVAEVSFIGNQQHNPGQPLHWDRSKSTDEADTMQRHFLQRGTRDTDGSRHSAKMVWRALAFLQKEIENELATQSCGVQLPDNGFIPSVGPSMGDLRSIR